MKPNLNRHTVGKQLRKNKGLRKKDPTATLIKPSKQLQDYIEHLKGQGIQIKDLAVAEFRTKNGLPYIGLIATSLFPSNKIFIRVPVDSLLNTRVAFHSPLKSFFEQNPKYFSKELHSNWQDHILLAFLLYEYGQGQKSEWRHLIANLSRDIDYLAFWKKEQFQMLQDPVLQKMAKLEREKYEKQAQQFVATARNYPDLFPANLLTEDNIRWIHIHLVTRCFGKYLEYTTMVPFAELLNHQCSDVYYTMYYNEDNPHNEGEEFYAEKVLTPIEIEQLDTSDGTYNSEQFDDDEQNWNNVKQIEKKEEQGKKDELPAEQQYSATSQEQVQKSIRETRNYLYNFINFGDNVSLGYLLEVYEALETLKTAKINPSLKKIEISRIQGSNSLYLNLVKWFHGRIKSSHYTGTFTQRKIKEEQSESEVQSGKQYFPEVWNQDKFDEFLMLCSTKDQFEEGAQVFFCYGRLSNRMLLMRYGITIQHNKYNHIYLRLDSKDYSVGYKAYPKVLHDLSLSRIIKIKVKRTKMCVELLTFLRGLSWKLHQNVEGIFYVLNLKQELEIVDRAINIYKKEMAKFSQSLPENEKLLEDPKTGYHEYFATVYRVQKQRILTEQIKLLRIATVILERVLQKKLQLKAAMLRVYELEDAEEMQRHRIMMRNYFDVFFK